MNSLFPDSLPSWKAGTPFRIGLSAWSHDFWRGTFYPKGLPQKQELAYASSVFSSIEINSSFHALQPPKNYLSWHEKTPGDFVFSVKAHQAITHVHRLRYIEAAMANFFSSGLLFLKEKLGPIIWQLPPKLKYDAELLEHFLYLLPHDTEALTDFSRRHHPPARERPWPESDPRRVRHALEVRDHSFQTEAFVEQLRKHRVALVIGDTTGKWPLMEDVTADFVYARMHGDEKEYPQGYPSALLQKWAAKFKAWAKGGSPTDAALSATPAPHQSGGREVFVYFNNEAKDHAPHDAALLAHLLGVSSSPPTKT